ncbi:hypothetical protein P170DRAFT_475087 [Aspergillus steynii IBT 23096]|uniref:Uncharacterized protein n=1 Tax=Aspergillus steynii IBT 23096 TaxID=1392250 RepID=A0A2I2G7A3_9EURO|nr:uncharacterized protein P170DRAFT_475087 [Aspergillus steynii IBT 23096]PLB48745.1 hypothetical protein P170DRAFT_475087 [Aspergillus steynii IBT 23096]
MSNRQTASEEIDAAFAAWESRPEVSTTNEDESASITTDVALMADRESSDTSFAEQAIYGAVDGSRTSFEETPNGEAESETIPTDKPREQIPEDLPPSHHGYYSSSSRSSSSNLATNPPMGWRTGTLNKFITEVTEGSKIPSSKEVVLRFSAFADKADITFDMDRYDCDGIIVEVRRNGLLERKARTVDDSFTVDVNVCQMDDVDEIQTISAYLAKEGRVAALIMRYVFDDVQQER